MQVCSRSQSFETICISVGLVCFSKSNFVCNAVNKLISQSVFIDAAITSMYVICKWEEYTLGY